MTPERTAYLRQIAGNTAAHGKIATGPLGEVLAQAADAIRELATEADELAALRIEHAAWGALLDATRADRDAARAEVATLRAEVTADKVRTDAIETARMWSVSAFHRARQERDEARDEVTALRAQVADLQRLGVSIHKAADAARKAERADVVAFLGKQAGSFHATNEIDACATLAGAKMAIQHGAHEGAAGGS